MFCFYEISYLPVLRKLNQLFYVFKLNSLLGRILTVYDINRCERIESI